MILGLGWMIHAVMVLRLYGGTKKVAGETKWKEHGMVWIIGSFQRIGNGFPGVKPFLQIYLYPLIVLTLFHMPFIFTITVIRRCRSSFQPT